MKSLVYEKKSQPVAEITGRIFEATVQISNDGTRQQFFWRGLERERTYPRESGGHFGQLL